MSAELNEASSNALSELSPEAVAQFLTENPTFFLKNEHLLADLYLPHASGEAVSLLERQVSILRERNIEMRKRTSDMLEQGQRNDALFLKTKKLILHLLDAQSLNDLGVRINDYCASEFQVDKVQFSLLANPETHRATHVRVLVENEVLQAMPSLLKSNECISGVFREEEFSFLFNKQHQGIQSAIILPVIHNGSTVGFLSLGSCDPHYFKAGMDTLFLGFIGDVISKLTPRFIK